MKRKRKEEDDGRVIADMRALDELSPYAMPRRPEQRPPDGEEEPPAPPFSKEERRAYVSGALKASLLIGGVFVVLGFLFILFCVKVWLR